MSDNNQSTPPDKTMFINLVSMLATSAIQQMAQKPDQEKGGAEAAMQSAQMIIDMIDMIERKTKGNLDSDEERMLHDTLSSLKLAFVETSARNKSQTPAEKKQEPAAEKTDKPEDGAAQAQDNKPPDNQPGEDKRKYHKSYG